MKFVNVNETRPTYDFLDGKCIGRACFYPSGGGCKRRRDNGCPTPLPEFDKDAAARNKAAGWRTER